MEVNLTKGNILKSLILFSIPIIIGNIFQQMYNVVDTLIVGQFLGNVALTAVGSSYALMVLLSSIIIGFTMGASVVFSHYFGANDTNKLKVAIFNAFIFILAIAVVLNILSYIFLDKFLEWINIPVEAIEMTKEYLTIIFIGIIFIFVYNFIASVLRALGNTKIALYFLICSTIINISLDYIFIRYLNMGVAGAAWATVIAQIFSALGISTYFLIKRKDLLPARDQLKFNKYILMNIIDNSSLTAIQQSIMNFGILMIQGLVNSYGLIVAAAFAAAVKIDAFAYMPAQDFGNAFASFIAQNHGANNKERIHKGLKTAMLVSIIFCLTSSVFVYTFAEKLMMIFVKAEEVEVIKVGVHYLRTVSVFYVGIGILFLWYGYYRGLGKSRQSIVLTVISLGLRVLLANILSKYYGTFGIWISIIIGWFIADLYGYYIYKNTKSL
ncbi:MATE family efflux transporter [Helcococcus massiliensis]|uniref:MATE family efflux transporter n=1 Tax=Helcococcus massiliensis TaxID=2040290 RepID=UPI000CDE71D8|nr:MATE family efflux transporter [Helcococcus massiliensis]